MLVANNEERRNQPTHRPSQSREFRFRSLVGFSSRVVCISVQDAVFGASTMRVAKKQERKLWVVCIFVRRSVRFRSLVGFSSRVVCISVQFAAFGCARLDMALGFCLPRVLSCVRRSTPALRPQTTRKKPTDPAHTSPRPPSAGRTAIVQRSKRFQNCEPDNGL